MNPAPSVIPGTTPVDESEVEDEPLFYRSAQLQSAAFNASNAAASMVETSNAELETVSAIFQPSQESHNSRLRIGLVVGSLALAMLAGGLWWKSHRQTASEPARARPVFCAQSKCLRSGRQTKMPELREHLEARLRVSIRNHPLQQLVTGIWNVSSADSSTVIIDLQGEVQYEAHRLSDPERIYFDLHGTSLAHGLFGKTIEVGDPMLARVRIAQPRQGVSRIVLETNGASDFSVSLQSNPYRLVVEIRKARQR